MGLVSVNVNASVAIPLRGRVRCLGPCAFTLPEDAFRWVIPPEDLTLTCDRCGKRAKVVHTELRFAPFGEATHPVYVIVIKEDT